MRRGGTRAGCPAGGAWCGRRRRAPGARRGKTGDGRGAPPRRWAAAGPPLGSPRGASARPGERREERVQVSAAPPGAAPRLPRPRPAAPRALLAGGVLIFKPQRLPADGCGGRGADGGRAGGGGEAGPRAAGLLRLPSAASSGPGWRATCGQRGSRAAPPSLVVPRPGRFGGSAPPPCPERGAGCARDGGQLLELLSSARRQRRRLPASRLASRGAAGPRCPAAGRRRGDGAARRTR